MGQGPTRVHQMFEGHHEQQGWPEGHVRPQGSFDFNGAFIKPKPPPRDGGRRQTDGRRLPRPAQRSRENSRGHHHCSRDEGGRLRALPTHRPSE